MKFVGKLLRCIRAIITLLARGDFANYNKLRKLNVETRDDLCILGNGSSLKDVSFSSQNNVDFMVVNRHVFSDDYVAKKPRFYVVADPHFFSHPEGLGVLEKIKERTIWEMYLFVPYIKQYRSALSKIMKDSPNIHCIPYSMSIDAKFEKINKWIYLHNLGMPQVSNVMVAAITIATFLGFKTIHLYGVEHSWTKYLFVNDRNESCLYNPHFYDKGEVEVKTMNEIFDHCLDYRNFGDWLHMYAYMFDSYHVVKRIALWNNVQVTNNTPGSFIDAFERGE